MSKKYVILPVLEFSLMLVASLAIGFRLGSVSDDDNWYILLAVGLLLTLIPVAIGIITGESDDR